MACRATASVREDATCSGSLDVPDANDDGKLDLSDAVFTLAHLFQGGAAPPAPGPETCGVDPTADDLSYSGACL